VNCVHIRYDSVFSLWYLRRDIDTLCEAHRALLEWTAQVDIAYLVTEVGLLLDKCD
jgi:hypothetical protein